MEDDGRGEADRLTTFVECADYFEVRDRALLAHATQIDPDGDWFEVPLDLQREVWPTPRTISWWRPRFPTSLPENDLFAGLR